MSDTKPDELKPGDAADQENCEDDLIEVLDHLADKLSRQTTALEKQMGRIEQMILQSRAVKPPASEKTPDDPKPPAPEKTSDDPKPPALEKTPDDPKPPALEKTPDDPKPPALEKTPDDPKPPSAEKTKPPRRNRKRSFRLFK